LGTLRRRNQQKAFLSPEARVLQAEAWLKQARSDHAALQRLFRGYQQRMPGHLLSTPESGCLLAPTVSGEGSQGADGCTWV